jgi:PAS domain S-box-containing protein
LPPGLYALLRLASIVYLRHTIHKKYRYQIGGAIKPRNLTRFWHRRICEAIMAVSIVILALYFWAYFADVSSISSSLLVPSSTAIAAGVTLFISFISYLWAPKQYVFWGSYAAFIILCATSSLLILTTGGTSSPFLALWMIVSVFAGVFGLYGVIPLSIAVLVFLILQLTGGVLGSNTVVAALLAGFLPLGISYFIWHEKSSREEGTQTAYRELATELSEVASKSEVVINAIADGVIALDGKGVIQLINPAAQQIIGWGRQDALSLDYKSVLKLVTKNDAELTPANDPVTQVLATNKEVTNSDLVLLTSTGKKKQVALVVSPIGQMGAGVIIVFRDITSEKAEEREQAEFISTASHEMRTPVASIEGYLGLALNPNTAQIDEKARDFITKAHESAQHLGRLFQDLLDVTKADDGRMANNPKVVDVVEFTHDIVQGLKPQADQKGLHILYKPQPDDTGTQEGGERRLSPVYYANVDNDHLREILSNLVENAIKYTKQGDVVVDVTGDNDHVVVSVADTGIGIPKEDQGHLFQKFYRVDNSDTREIGGTGLGLYLSRRLAEAMSGRIWVESEYKRGSTFYLEIPRIDHEEAMRLIESSAPAPTPEIGKATIEQPTLPVQETAPAATPSQPTIHAVQPAQQAMSTPTAYTPPQPQSQAQPTQADAAYTNAPAEAIAKQLQSISPMQQTAPLSTPPPVTQPLPQNTPPTHQTQQPAVSQSAPTPVSVGPEAPYYRPAAPGAARPNTPLTSIEQHPDQYITNRPSGVPVPPRREN